MEEHHPLDPLLWASILEDSRVSGVLGASSWVVWIHEELHLDQFCLVHVRSIKLVHLLLFGSKMSGGVLVHKRKQISRRFRILLMAIVQISQQLGVTTLLYVERIAIYV
jgi:hypothetical protein